MSRRIVTLTMVPVSERLPDEARPNGEAGKGFLVQRDNGSFASATFDTKSRTWDPWEGVEFWAESVEIKDV